MTDEIVCRIDALAHDGRGLHRPEDGGPVIFVAGSLPGGATRAGGAAGRGCGRMALVHGRLVVTPPLIVRLVPHRALLVHKDVPAIYHSLHTAYRVWGTG